MAGKGNYPARQQTQQPQNQPKKKASNLADIKSILKMDTMKARFQEILGQKAPQFMASIINAVSTTPALQECDSNSVIQSALIAATYDLPIDSNLGFSAIVPYKKKGVPLAQFQMMYKGYIQLAIRSGEYADMNVAEVYADELHGYNPITGEVYFVDDFSRTTMRAQGDPSNVVGYYAWFRLNKGFSHALYMTRQDVDNHARRYSEAYKWDLAKGWTSSRWSQDFDAMAKKTAIKLLLSKWGILSIDMQRAIADDQKVYDADGNGLYADNPEAEQPEEVVDVFAEDDQRQTLPEQPEEPATQMEEQQSLDMDEDGFMDDDGKLPWD